jgi:predicted amidohydrolase
MHEVYDFDLMRNKLRSAVSESAITIALTGFEKGNKATAIFSSDSEYGTYCSGGINRSPLSPIQAGAICLGILHDNEISTPEAARCLMLGGATLILHIDAHSRKMTQAIARTRASENRIYLIRQRDIRDNDSSFIVSPDGVTLTTSIPGREQAISALIRVSDAVSKTVVPGTDIVLSRRPNLYQELIK